MTMVYNGQSDGTSVLNCAPAGASVEGKALPVLCRKIEQSTSDATGAQGFSSTLVGTARVWNFTYDKYGQVLTEDGPRTDAVDRKTYTYYADNDADINKRGRRATVTNAVGHTTSYLSYNPYGQPLTVRDQNGIDTTYAYDLRQRLLSMSRLGEVTGFAYDPAGALTRVTQPNGSFVAYTYDAAHRLTGITDGLGNSITYTLDNAGNRTAEQVKDSGGTLRRSVARVMDALGRVQSVTGAVQ
jgi:YD repeat-containing protein